MMPSSLLFLRLLYRQRVRVVQCVLWFPTIYVFRYDNSYFSHFRLSTLLACKVATTC